jgi:DNA-binding response OmpR family regulator
VSLRCWRRSHDVPSIVFSRERCITLAWPDDTDAINRTFDVNVARLRRIFGRPQHGEHPHGVRRRIRDRPPTDE